ncbi:AAA family ATPase [Cellulomonas sp. ATA003]|uniref:uridine kinase family protein n=1 Tax=Cellulomonas sp. ATA003 TaxID=3073064 RepID=UPI0028736A71|nr:AAA family ATPase [Cellulomonas sp. ATA003]WNB84806.1 AAA family ATPase [Cellulomonas sp. ATA003]
MSGADVADPRTGGAGADGAVAGIAARVRAAEPRLGSTRLVVVDGPAGSGKTTLAGRLGEALGAPVLHADDLLAGWGDLEGWWDRLDANVLRPLGEGRPGRYRRYDWLAGAFGEACDVPVTDVLVVEGCGSARRAADDVAAVRVWVEAPDDLRLARGLERDGEELRPQWLAWMDAEARHYAVERTRERADVVVDGTRPWAQ